MVIATAIKILYATSNSCKLSFQVLTKKFIDGKPLTLSVTKTCIFAHIFLTLYVIILLLITNLANEYADWRGDNYFNWLPRFGT